MLQFDKLGKDLKSVLKKHSMKIKAHSGDVYDISDGIISFSADLSAFREHDYSEEMLDDVIMRRYKMAEAESRMVSFTNGQAFLRFVLTAAENVTPSMVTLDFTDNLKKVAVYTADDHDYKLISGVQLKKWDVPMEVAFSAADKNMCRMMDKCEFRTVKLRPEVNAVEIEPVYPEFMASFIACGDFRMKMSKLLGDKFIVLAPSDESVIAVDNLTEEFYGEITKIVSKEYRAAEKPLTTSVLIFDRSGVTEAGNIH